MQTIVIGAGWAGLSCAYILAKAGQRVTLIEAAPQVGGRARSINFRGNKVDNGQHVCLGAYHSTLALAKDLGLDHDKIFVRKPLALHMHGAPPLKLNLPAFKAPYNLLWSVSTAKNISWREKLHTVNFCLKINQNSGQLKQDCSVATLLQRFRQPSRMINGLWKPLTLATMTTPIETASAQVFINTLRQSFLHHHSDSNWLLPRKDLSAILPNHIVDYLKKNNCHIITGTPINKIDLNNVQSPRVFGHDQSWQADNIVVAVPPWKAKNLLPMPELESFAYEPITTAYFMCDAPIDLPYPIMGFQNGLSQWIFDRRFCGQPNILSVIISGAGEHMIIDKSTLKMRILDEINSMLPNKIHVIDSLIVKEKRAAFSCDVKIQSRRPNEQTRFKNIWLAGDYLQTGLPATLEGAVLSGMQTGNKLLRYIASL